MFLWTNISAGCMGIAFCVYSGVLVDSKKRGVKDLDSFVVCSASISFTTQLSLFDPFKLLHL